MSRDMWPLHICTRKISLTLCCRVAHQTLIVAEIVKKLVAFYGTRGFFIIVCLLHDDAARVFGRPLSATFRTLFASSGPELHGQVCCTAALATYWLNAGRIFFLVLLGKQELRAP